LRNPLDTEEAKTQGTAMASLWTGQRVPLPTPTVTKPRPAAPPAPVPVVVETPKPAPPKSLPPIIVQIIHGANKTEAKFAQKEKESEEK
jgi:hypothetical protein